jgi:putative colanic acid biosynthesis acetyltransferase WcaF
MKIENFTPVQTTPYNLKTKLKIYLWKLVNKTIFRIIPNQIRQPRIILLNFFGAKISNNVFIHRNSNIEHPWNLEVGYLSSIGEDTWIYCLDKIIIGQKCTIGKNVSLITGSHHLDRLDFRLKTKPIIIKDGCWITTGAVLLPGVSLSEFTVIGVNSVVNKDSAPFDVISGNPAKVISTRKFLI